MKAYTSIRFEIKPNPYVTSDARQNFKAISLVKKQSDEVQKVGFPVLLRNAYFSHAENILIAMLADENANTRKLTWRRIKKNCSEKSSKKLRKLKIPELNF